MIAESMVAWTGANFCLWLQADLPAPRIDFRSTPSMRHYVVDVGFRAVLVCFSPSTGRAGTGAIRSKMTRCRSRHKAPEANGKLSRFSHFLYLAGIDTKCRTNLIENFPFRISQVAIG